MLLMVVAHASLAWHTIPPLFYITHTTAHTHMNKLQRQGALGLMLEGIKLKVAI